MRKNKNNASIVKQCPVGILPLGQTNRVANSLFYGYDNSVEIRKLADATMAVVKGNTKLTDVVEIELLEVTIEIINFFITINTIYNMKANYTYRKTQNILQNQFMLSVL